MAPAVLVAVGAVDYEAQVLAVERTASIQVVRRCVDVADLVATAATQQVDVAVVSLGLRGVDAELVERVQGEGVVVVGVVASIDERAELQRIGVQHIVTVDELDQIAAVVFRLHAEAISQAAAGALGSLEVEAREGDWIDRDAGTVIAVWGPTGAPGRSTVAVGLAAALAERGSSVLLIDADVYGGAIASMLGMLDESSGLLAAARAANSGTLTSEVLAGHARKISSYLDVLTGIPRADRWTEVKSVLVRSILRSARDHAAYVVVDCGFSLEFDEEISYDTAAPRRNGATVAVLEQADSVVLVGAADPVGLARMIRGVSELSTVVPAATPRLVVNKLRPSLTWSRDEVVTTVMRATGSTAVTVLPNDPTACDQALVHGQSVIERQPDSKLAKAFRALAVDVCGAPTPGQPRERRVKGRRRRRGA